MTDSINPQTIIAYPTNTSYATAPTQFNYTYVETNCDKAWYSNNTGLTNYSTVACGTNWSNMVAVEGGNNWTVFVNDTAGNENSSIVYFTLDTTKPFVNLIYPTNTTYTESPTQLNFSLSDINLESCWYSVNSSINVSTSCSVNITNLTSSEGTNTWTIYANDSVGNENSSSVSFTLDTTAPFITINNPSEGEEEGSSTMVLSITTNEITSCNYSINSGTNTSLETSDNLTFTKSLQLIYGSYSVIFNCEDNYNHSNSSSVNFVMFVQGTGATSSGGTSPSVTYLTENISTINLETIEIQNKKLCIGEDKLYFKSLDNEKGFTLLNSSKLYLNDSRKSNKVLLDLTNERYYYNLENLKKGEIEVKIIGIQNGKEVSETMNLTVEKCLNFEKLSEDKLISFSDFITENKTTFFYSFIGLFILGLISYVIYTFKFK